MSKKILIAAGLYPPDIGGPATYVAMVEHGLPKRGIDVKVIPFSKVRTVPKSIRHLAYVRLLYKASKGCDAIFAQDAVSVGVPAYIVSVLTGKKFLLRLGGDYAWEQGRQRFGLEKTLDQYTADRSGSAWQVKVLALVQDFITRRAVFVSVASSYLKSVIDSWPRVKKSRVRVVYSALFPLPYKGTRESIRQELSYQGTVLVSVGRLVPWKGFVGLIQVVADLKKEIPDLSLVIAGGGPQEAELKGEIQKLGAEEYITLTGPVSKEVLAPTIKGSDMFVFNTGYEGLSHQLLEVMHIGVPIVTTSAGGNTDLITDGVSGLLTQYNDLDSLKKAVLRMYESDSLRATCVQNARSRAAEFAEDIVLDSLVGELKAVL